MILLPQELYDEWNYISPGNQSFPETAHIENERRINRYEDHVILKNKSDT